MNAGQRRASHRGEVRALAVLGPGPVGISPALSHDARPPPPEKQVAEAEKWVAGAQLIR